MGETYLVGADGERDDITMMRDVLAAMGEPADALRLGCATASATTAATPTTTPGSAASWGRCRGHTDFAEGLVATIAWYSENEDWWRPAKEATEAKYAAQGQ